MLNCDDFDSLMLSCPMTAANAISALLSESTAFSDIENFATHRGVYFLYLTDGGALLYIGSAYAMRRTIKNRCRQYLQEGNGGDSFVGKIAYLKNISRDKAIDFIRNNVEARFIFCSDLGEQVIQQRERLCIWAFRPLLNFIQPNSTLAALAWK